MTRTAVVTPDLDELRRAAEGADSGPWTYHTDERGVPFVYGPSSNPSIPDPDVVATTRYSDRFTGNDRANMAHIAAWCPANALATLDVVADLRDRLAKTEVERDAMREALQQRANGRRKANLREAVTWLHDRAETMNDPKARVVLNSAAFSLGGRAAALVAGQEEASTAFVESDLNPGVDPAKRAIMLAADRVAALLLEEANHDVRQGIVLAKQAVMRGIVLKAVDGQEAGR